MARLGKSTAICIAAGNIGSEQRAIAGLPTAGNRSSADWVETSINDGVGKGGTAVGLRITSLMMGEPLDKGDLKNSKSGVITLRTLSHRSRPLGAVFQKGLAPRHVNSQLVDGRLPENGHRLTRFERASN